nr:hypothetical protein [Tanacetum cinerariifolium]
MPLLEEKRSHCQVDRTAINVKKKLPVKDGSYAKLVPYVPGSYRVSTARRTSHCQRRKMPLLEEKRGHCQVDRTAINVKKKLPVKDGSYA